MEALIQSWRDRFRSLRAVASVLRRPIREFADLLRRPAVRFRFVATVMLIFCMATICHIKARKASVILDFGVTNGTFQNYNPLRRLDDGQAMFRDFYPYLGVGPTLMSFAALKAVGTTFADSLYALEMAAGLAYVGVLILLGRLCRLSWFWTCATATVLVCVGNWMYPSIEELYQSFGRRSLSQFHVLFFAGQSAIAFRSLIPLLIVATLLMRRSMAPSAPEWMVRTLDASLAGAALVWSNDYGAPTFGLYCLLFGLLAPEGSLRERMKRTALIAAAGLVVALLILTTVTHGAPLKWLQYNAGVAADQFWYFEGRKILRWSEIPAPPSLWLALGTSLIMAVVLRENGDAYSTRCLLFVLLSHLAAAYLSTLGGHYEEHYFSALRRALLFAAPCAAIQAIALLAGGMRRRRFEWHAAAQWLTRNQRLGWSAMVLQTVLVGAAIRHTHHQHRDCVKHCRLPTHFVRAEEMGGCLNEHWSKLVAVAREIRDEPAEPGERVKLFSTYSTALETIAGTFQPTGHDYIIHALGPQERARYLASLRETRPKYVATLRRDHWPWEIWSRNVHWDFYRELFCGYDPFDRTQFHQLWVRRSQPRQFPNVTVRVRVERREDGVIDLYIDLPADAGLSHEDHYIDVSVHATGEWRTRRFWNGAWRQRLAVVDPTAEPGRFTHRFAVPLDRPHSFCVLARPGQSTRRQLRLEPAEHSRLELTNLFARYVLPAHCVDDFPLSRLRASCVDSAPWCRGLWCVDDNLSIVTISDPTDLKHVRPGQQVRFAFSGTRTISRIVHNHLYVTGPPLNPDQDGFPHVIKVLP